MKDHGLFLSRRILAMPTPTEVQLKRAREVLGDEGFELFDLVRRGTPIERVDARNCLLTIHKGLIGKVIGKFASNIISSRDPAVTLEDAWSIGRIGLWHAIETFDYALGLRFSSHGIRCVKSYLGRELFPARDGVVVPPHVKYEIQNYRKMLETFESEEDIKIALGVLPKTFERIRRSSTTLKLGNPFNSLRAKMFRHGIDGDVWDIFVGHTSGNQEDKLVEKETKQLLFNALTKLNERERLILSLRFGIGKEAEMTLEEAGKLLGISREGVRLIEVKALKKLASFLTKYKGDFR